MSIERHAPLALCALATLSLLAAPAAEAAEWSDAWLSYRYGTQYREPNNPNDIAKNIISFTYAGNYSLGGNYVNVDMLISDNMDKANNSTQGAQEVYVVYRTLLSFNKAFKMDTKFGPVRDIGLTLGFDLNSKNTTFAPNKRALVAGPVIRFDVPGFLDVGVWYYKEQNHKGIPNTPRPNVTFDGTYMLQSAWLIPFELSSVPLKFQGFANYIGAKGLDYNNKQTDPETLMRTSLMLDVGQLVASRKNTVWVGVAYEYWHNKFGNQPGVGTEVNAPGVQVEWHF